MTLGQKQRRFTLMVAELIQYAYSMDYEMTFGDAYRDPRAPYGHPDSNHRKRLAIDLNLFKDGEYLKDGVHHAILHDYWDMIGGAERISNDMNHYSLEWRGMR